MVYNYASGESDGIKWSVDYDSELGNWIVVATDGKNKVTREFFSAHDPVFGVDGIDMEQIKTVIGRVTVECMEMGMNQIISDDRAKTLALNIEKSLEHVGKEKVSPAMRRHRKRRPRKGGIYLLREGALVTVRGTGSLGGAMFRTTKEMYVMCTFCGKMTFIECSPCYLEGYFVEPSSFGCIKNECEIVFSETDITDGPFGEDDMTVNPMFGIYRPMAKRDRIRHLKANREALASRDGIIMSDEFIEKADVGGFMAMFAATFGDA